MIAEHGPIDANLIQDVHHLSPAQRLTVAPSRLQMEKDSPRPMSSRLALAPP
jgi:hypothetical protein